MSDTKKKKKKKTTKRRDQTGKPRGPKKKKTYPISGKKYPITQCLKGVLNSGKIIVRHGDVVNIPEEKKFYYKKEISRDVLSENVFCPLEMNQNVFPNLNSSEEFPSLC